MSEVLDKTNLDEPEYLIQVVVCKGSKSISDGDNNNHINNKELSWDEEYAEAIPNKVDTFVYEGVSFPEKGRYINSSSKNSTINSDEYISVAGSGS